MPPRAVSSLIAGGMLPVWVAILVFTASAGVKDAPSEGTPIVLAFVCVLAIPYGLVCGLLASPVLASIFLVNSNRFISAAASGLVATAVFVLIGSSMLGFDHLGLKNAWSIIPYVAALVFAPPFAAGFIAYCMCQWQQPNDRSSNSE